MHKNTYGGLLIAIDGPNGVGKTTLIENIQIYLAEMGVDVYVTKEPSVSKIGEFTRIVAEEFSGDSLACLVAADRYIHLLSEVIPKLQDGQIVIMDRYILSSLILQRIDGVEVSFILGVNQNIILPDIQFAIFADVDIIQKRLSERTNLTRFEAGNQTHQELHFLEEGIEELRGLGVQIVTIENNSYLNDGVKEIVKYILVLRKGAKPQ